MCRARCSAFRVAACMVARCRVDGALLTAATVLAPLNQNTLAYRINEGGATNSDLIMTMVWY